MGRRRTILACIGSDAASADVVRHAKRMADSLRAPWTAVHVETGRNLNLGEAERDRIAEAMRLAERLGAETVTLPGQDVADTIADYARANKSPNHHRAAAALDVARAVSRSLAQQLIRKSGRRRRARSRATANTERRSRVSEVRTREARAYPGSLGFVAVSLGVALLLHQRLGVAAWRWRSSPRCWCLPSSTDVAGVVRQLRQRDGLQLLLLPPLYTFTIEDPENVAALFFFGVTAVIASNLTARVRAQAIVARQSARTTEELYQFSRKLASAANLDDLLWATVHQIALMLKVRVVILLPEEGRVAVRAGFPPEDTLDDAELPRRGGVGKGTISPGAVRTRCLVPSVCSCR